MNHTRIALKLLIPHPDNPNGDRLTEGINELARSIEAVGLMHPLHITPIPGSADVGGEGGGFYVIAGCRRLMALPLAGYHPNDEVDCVLREGDIDIEMIRFVENEQRRSVHPLDQAEHVDKLLEGANLEAVAEMLGESQHRLRQLQSLAALPPDAKKLFREGQLTWGHMRLLVQVQDPKELMEFAESWAGGEWDGPTPIERCRRDLMKESKLLSKAPWKLDADDLPNGACSTCQYNTGLGDMLFEELADKARCSNVACYEEKGRAFQDVYLIRLDECGDKVMSLADAAKREKEYRPNGWVPLSMSLGAFNNGAPTKGRTTLKTLVGKSLKPWTYIPLDDYSVMPHARRLAIERVLIEKGLATSSDLGYEKGYKPGDPVPKSKEGQSTEKAGERRAKQNQKVITELCSQMQQRVSELDPDAAQAAFTRAVASMVMWADPLAMNKYGKAHGMELAEGESPSRYAWGPLFATRVASMGMTDIVALLLELVIFARWPAKFRPELDDEVKKIAKLVGVDLKPIIVLSKEKKLPKKGK